MKVAVAGAGGRMGSTVCAAVAADRECELVAAVDPHHEGIDLHLVARGTDLPPLTVAGGAEEFERAEVDVVVDFTHLEAACDNLAWAAEKGVHAVVGTTGFSAADLARFESTFTDSNCMIVPNFAIGAVLMMRFAAEASRIMDRAEIVELHHPCKLDATSCTHSRTSSGPSTPNRTFAVIPGSPPLHLVSTPHVYPTSSPDDASDSRPGDQAVSRL